MPPPLACQQPDPSRCTDYPDLSLRIGGAWRKPGQILPVVNLAKEGVTGQVPVVCRQDPDNALDAAAKGFRIWRATAPRARAEVIARAKLRRIDAIKAFVADVSAKGAKLLTRGVRPKGPGCFYPVTVLPALAA